LLRLRFNKSSSMATSSDCETISMGCTALGTSSNPYWLGWARRTSIGTFSIGNLFPTYI
jgi:hypothetical protein